MKKRSVLAVVSLAAGAAIAAISPPPGGDASAAAAEPVHALGALDEAGDVGRLVDSASGATTATTGLLTTAVSGAQPL
ncbi:hypothetical protein EES43_21385 [Streptomyces sp. ADI96-02]|uniref:hypothetical protein n=1 Tax=unclassified Streptomyces TaxID=2593676 RepID=UPI000F54F72A|nr:hypothetical protein [Streptomyces sp. ADI96-02]RPK57717.1 hypothetical protein EES43_21385 [Streptomyces sp. ADI96-02]